MTFPELTMAHGHEPTASRRFLSRRQYANAAQLKPIYINGIKTPAKDGTANIRQHRDKSGVRRLLVAHDQRESTIALDRARSR
jgi:hypothetical protein